MSKCRTDTVLFIDGSLLRSWTMELLRSRQLADHPLIALRDPGRSLAHKDKMKGAIDFIFIEEQQDRVQTT